MKQKNLLAVALILSLATFTSCGNKKAASSADNLTSAEDSTAAATSIITDSLRFCESTYPYQGGILIANFGTEELNPMNTEGKGYIVFAKDGKSEKLIPADGNLSAPKGMLIQNDYLYICDVNKIVVYNLANLKAAPQTIRFPKDDLFVNDLITNGNTLFASVTNSGRIYQIDIAHPEKQNQAAPVLWTNIPGPNGLTISDGTMYIASYPADGKTTDANIIYQITDLSKPKPEAFLAIPGQYDGIALSADKRTMYITNWSPAEVSAIDMKTKQITSFYSGNSLVGAADITVTGDTLYIPDLPNSKVIRIAL